MNIRHRSEKKKVVLVRIYPEYGDCGAVMCPAAHSLGIRYLKAYCEADRELRGLFDIRILELPAASGARRIAAAVEKEAPEIAGFSIYVDEYPVALEAAALLKRRRPGAINIFGGLRVLDAVSELQRHVQMDAFVMGEGEIPFSEMLRCIAGGRDFSGIPGIAWRTGGGVAGNPGGGGPDEIPEIFTPGYVSELAGAVRFPTARGCPRRCSYCPEAVAVYREIPLERVLRGLGLLLRNQRIRLIVFDDPDFGHNRKRFSSILDFIIERNADGKALAGCWSALDAGRPLLEKMKRAGFTQEMDVSLQSGSAGALAAVNRGRMSPERLGKSAPGLLAVFPGARAELIVGLPAETLDTFIDTLVELYRMWFRSVRAHRLRVYPATQLHGSAERFGLKFQAGGHYQAESTASFTPEDFALAEAAVLAYNVLARLLPPRFADAWEALGVRLPELLRNPAGLEMCVKENRRPPGGALDAGGLKRNALNILRGLLAAEGAPAESLEKIRELSRLCGAMEEYLLRTRDKAAQGETGGLVPGYAEVRAGGGALPFLGLGAEEGTGERGRRPVFILYDYEREKAVPVTSPRPVAFRRLLKELCGAGSVSEFVAGVPENRREAVKASIGTLARAGLLRPQRPR